MRTDHFSIRPMTPGDIPDGMRLKTAAGWNQTEDDWRLYLDIGGDGCFAAELLGKVIGTVTTIDYGGRFSWIGMVLVDPAYRRKGIGASLMNRAIDYLEGRGTIRLDATPLGKTVYDNQGFVEEYGLVRLVCPSLDPDTADADKAQDVSPLTSRDLPRVADMDRSVFGADRQEIFKHLVRANTETAWKREVGGSTRGYCLGRPGTKHYQIGPVVGETPEDAIAVFRAAFREIEGASVVVDVPETQTDFLSWLKSVGFREERPFIRMCRGKNEFPGDPSRIFGIAGPELG